MATLLLQQTLQQLPKYWYAWSIRTGIFITVRQVVARNVQNPSISSSSYLGPSTRSAPLYQYFVSCCNFVEATKLPRVWPALHGERRKPKRGRWELSKPLYIHIDQGLLTAGALYVVGCIQVCVCVCVSVMRRNMVPKPLIPRPLSVEKFPRKTAT